MHVSVATREGGAPGWLVWARYNFFFVLYVTGAVSEWVCMYKSLPEAQGVGMGYYWFTAAQLVVWPLGEWFSCEFSGSGGQIG